LFRDVVGTGFDVLRRAIVAARIRGIYELGWVDVLQRRSVLSIVEALPVVDLTCTYASHNMLFRIEDAVYGLALAANKVSEPATRVV
jgi:hypothetical protein